MKNLKLFITLATALVATSLGFAQTIVNPDDEVGSPAASAPVTTSAPVTQDPAPVDLSPQVQDLQNKITELENRKVQAQQIKNVTVRRQTLRVIQDVSYRYKRELTELNDHVRRVIQPEVARVRGYASEGVRLARMHETKLAALDARIKALESSVVTGGAVSTAPLTTPTTAVPPVTGTSGVTKVNTTNWFQEALQGTGQILTVLVVLVVIVLLVVGLFNLLQGMSSSKAAGVAADKRAQQEADRIARTVAGAQWASTPTGMPSWAVKGKVKGGKSVLADGSNMGESSYEFSVDDASPARPRARRAGP